MAQVLSQSLSLCGVGLCRQEGQSTMPSPPGSWCWSSWGAPAPSQALRGPSAFNPSIWAWPWPGLVPGGRLLCRSLPAPRGHKAVVLWGRSCARSLHSPALQAATSPCPQRRRCQLCSAELLP